MSGRKKRWRIAGRYTVDFAVEVEADTEAEAVANVKDDVNMMLDSAMFEDVDIDDVDEVKP